MNYTFTLFIALFICQSTYSQNNPDFYVENGTCKCPNANFGDTGTVTINGQQQTFTKRTRAQLDELIAENTDDPEIALTCTSGITDMSDLFEYSYDFNQNINHWDVSNVTDMSYMFFYAEAFNLPLDNWDVSNVTDMSNMFYSAVAFNQPLDNWNVSNVTDMSYMFGSADAFNQPLNNWDLSNVTDMSSMFRRADAFNQPLNNWDVSNVTDMSWMFYDAEAFNQPLDNWEVSNVTDMHWMFEDASVFNQDLSGWCVEQISTEPINFSTYSPLQDSFQPDWGAACTLGIQDNALIDVSVYPNPVKESFRLEVNDNMTLQKMKIYSIRGRLVDEIEDLSQPINVSPLKTGVYILRIESASGKIMNKRIIKR